MVYEEVKVELTEAKKWEKGMVVEGILKGVKNDIGPNKSKIYVVDDTEYWGAGVLDNLMSKVGIGQKVKITCTDDAKKFEKGLGKDFSVEIDR